MTMTNGTMRSSADAELNRRQMLREGQDLESAGVGVDGIPLTRLRAMTTSAHEPESVPMAATGPRAGSSAVR